MYFKRILDLREERNENQTVLANYLSVQQNTYSGYETGKINIPVDALIKLADYYDVSLDYLVGRSDKKR